MRWESIRADEFCESVRDGTHDTPKEVEIGFKLVTAKNIRNGQIYPDESYNISENDYLKINERSKVEQWDVLMSMIGNGLGRSAVVKATPSYAIKNLALFKVRDEVKAEWLHYFLSSEIGQGFIYNSLQGSGQPFISLNLLRAFPIPTPQYETMKKIVDIVSKYDDLIENNQKQIKLLEEAAQRLYKEWFIDLRFPGHENVKIVGGVPEGWKQCTLGEMASILRRGISPKYDDDGKYLVISQKCIRRSIMDTGEARRESKEYAPELNLQDADTVICSTGTGTLGRVGQVCGTYPDTTFDSHVTLVRTENYQNFFYQAVKSQQEFLIGMGRGSTNQQELYRDVIKNLQILVPTQEILNKAEKMLSSIHHKVTALNSQILLLIEVRDRLLPKLMSGELEV